MPPRLRDAEPPPFPTTRFRSVVFDCDSTLSSVEGIEELAAAHRDEIARLTEAAMRGEVPLEQVYGRRLDLVRPTRAQLDAVGRRYVETLVPDTREVIAALKSEGIAVRVMSGGLAPAVEFLARELGLDARDVAAVGIRFDADGAYAGYDEHSPLAQSGGKLAVMRTWGAALPRPVMLVGDGATDLEARPAVDCFVAFAGVVARPNVVAAADVVVRERSLAPVLALALGGGPPRDPTFAPLLDRALAMLGARVPTDTR